MYHEYTSSDGVVSDFFYLTFDGINEIFENGTELESPTQTSFFLPLPMQKVLRRRIEVLQDNGAVGITDRVGLDDVSSIGELNRLVFNNYIYFLRS